MLDNQGLPPLSSRVLQERYGHGYFHGEGSGFASEGYGARHASWSHWPAFLAAEVGAGARWLDVGCAYGFLVAEARSAGFRALGVDASRFALGESSAWASGAVGHLASAHAECLPFAADSFDVVTAFDVLEHVPEPIRVLAEIARVLRPGGILAAATPDPLLFDRHESTHVSERVPSWWVRELERFDLAVSLRFFQAPYNCELIARRGGPAPRVAFDGLGVTEPVVRIEGSSRFDVSLRSGFGEVLEGGTRIVSDGAQVHLLNRGVAPVAVDLAVELVEASGVTVAFDGRVVERAVPRAIPGPPATGETAAPQRVSTRLLVPAGGHGLRLGIERGWAHLVSITARVSAGDREELKSGLPFDLYERYALTGEILSRLAPGASRLLDVGGTMGAGGTHLAWTGDFFPDRRVTVVDCRAADYPEHVVVESGAPLPFPDRAFDVVIALDVLEHVPPPARERWLEEVWRVADRWLVLGNPFATPGVPEADRYLFELIRTRYGYEHTFLAEHIENGLPDVDATRGFFAGRGASVAVLPSGYLPAWALLQTLNAWLSHPEQDASFTAANRLANRAIGLASTAAPAYRHLLVVDRHGRDHAEALASLVRSRPPDLEGIAVALEGLSLQAKGQSR